MRRPTRRDYNRLATVAANIAAAPPRRRTPHAQNAIVPWDLIVEMRTELDRAGVDWRAAKAKAEGSRGWASP